MSEPLISTTIITWNRAHLLRTTLESYLAATSLPYELTIVDNGSTDGSREIIERVCRREATIKALFLGANLGGEAINSGFEAPRGRYLHVSENDLEYLPGWDADLISKF